jgi:hypothetical protein
MRFCLALWLTVFPQSAPPPDTEIFLASLTVREGQVTIGTAVDISNNPGYDNQPSFTPDGAALLFTSVRGGRKPDPANNAASGSDIYRYDVGPGRITQLTNTAESEYSPTVFDPRTRQATMLVAAPPGAAEVDTAWTPDGMLLVAQGATLFGWRKGDPAFTPVADLSALGLRGVTRLAISPKGDRIALVAQPR